MSGKMQYKVLWKVMALFLVLFFVAGCVATGAQPQAEEAVDVAEPAQAEEVAQAEAEESTQVEGKPRIVFVTPLLGHPVWLEAKRGAEDAAKEYGFDVEWVGPSTIDIDAEIQQVETAIATDADAILNCPLSPEAFTGVYGKAQEAGIPIINVAVDTSEETRTAFIGTGMVEYGQKAADILAEKMDGKANVAIIMTSLDAGNQVAEANAFEARLEEKYPEMKVVVRETDNSDMAIAVDKINQILLTYPEVDSFLMLVAEGAPAAAQVLKEKDRTDIVVLGIDDMDETLQAIRDGWVWATLAQNFYAMGYDGTKLALDAIEGQDVPSVVDSGTIYIDKENVDSYK